MSSPTEARPCCSRPARSFLPPVAVLELTYRCNQECIFCSCPWFAPGGDYDVRAELSADEWIRVIDLLGSLGVCELAFTGGEPLLKEGLDRLIEHASSLSVEWVESQEGELVTRIAPPGLFLLTNGRALDRRILDLCSAHGVHVGLSLPGMATFAAHTGGADPRIVLDCFPRCRDRGITTSVGVTVTRKNLHELYETIAGSLLAGADSLLLNRFLPGGRGLAHAPELELRADDLRTALDTAETVLRTAHRHGHVGTELPLCLVDGSRYTHLSVATRCSAAVGFFVVDPSGYIRVCNHSPVRLHHVGEVERVRDHPYWRRFVTKDYLPESCNRCGSWGACDGGCREAAHVVHGAADGPDPMLSARNRADAPGA